MFRAVTGGDLYLLAPRCSVALVDVGRARLVAVIIITPRTHNSIVARDRDRIIAEPITCSTIACRDLCLLVPSGSVALENVGST